MNAPSPERASERPEVRLELTSNPLYLSGARELVSAVARRLGFSEESCGQISLAVDEALCNVIRHGYARQTGRPIWVSLYPIQERSEQSQTVGPPTALKIVIEDEARQVDPSTIRSRDLDEIRPGGLGVHIIQAVMDEVVYEQRENTAGMRLTMTKSRTDQHAANGCSLNANEGSTCCGGRTETGGSTGCETSHQNTGAQKPRHAKDMSGKTVSPIPPAAAAARGKDVPHG